MINESHFFTEKSIFTFQNDKVLYWISREIGISNDGNKKIGDTSHFEQICTGQLSNENT